MKLSRGDALIVVDVQNDFCPGGAIPIPEGDRIVPRSNLYIDLFRASGAPVVATRDWHPRDHISFRSRGGIWPVHCVQGSWGGAFHSDLRLFPEIEVISKGTDPHQEAYSAFQGTALAERLRTRGVERVFVGGLATDYCVLETILDARRSGFAAYFLEDASAGVGAQPGDLKAALSKMTAAGAGRVRRKTIDRD